MAINIDKKVSSILLKRGLITSDKNNEILKQSEKDKISYLELLSKNNLLSPTDILGAIATESNVPPIDIDKIQVDHALVQSLPQEKAKSYGILPIAKIGNAMTIAVSNPFDILKIDELKLVLNCEVRLVLALETKIQEGIQRVYNPGEKEMDDLLEKTVAEDVELTKYDIDEDVNATELSAAAEDAPIVKFVNMIIYKALQEGASDIHVEPFEKKVVIRYRKDGVLHEALTPPKKLFNAIISRMKIMTSLDIAERRIPQDGKFQIKFEGRQIDFRVSTLPTIFGEKVVMRVLDSSSITMGLDVLGFEPQALGAFRKAINAPYGMLLVTGPTGSGKSTTLYSAVKEILSPEENFMTVEDPVEYQLEGVGQIPVNAKRGLTFALALRAILRQDPNKVVIGEIRDGETAGIAVKAAMTGHLVLSTLHTNDAPSSISRLIDMGVDPFLVSSSVILLSAQRLARKLCQACKRPYDKLPPEEKLIEIGFRPEDFKNMVIYRPTGCPMCNEGYKGRFAFLEALEIDDEIRKMIIKGTSVLDIREHGIKQMGMIPLRRCGILNVIRGKTTIEEVLRITEA
ncbi:MAG: Flp pilus assembly complex ATPase component TadA [Planctomycetes bacterium]|nr:Flp pilus assembly complex ATPase component TadA [Planctomycetota bacterium]